MSLVARAGGPVPWRWSPGRNGFSRLQPLLPVNWGVRHRPVLPVAILRYQASCIERVSGVRAALTRAHRRCCSCGARSRGPKHSQVVKHEVPKDPGRFPCTRAGRRIFRCRARGRPAEDAQDVRCNGAGST